MVRTRIAADLAMQVTGCDIGEFMATTLGISQDTIQGYPEVVGRHFPSPLLRCGVLHPFTASGMLFVRRWREARAKAAANHRIAVARQHVDGRCVRHWREPDVEAVLAEGQPADREANPAVRERRMAPSRASGCTRTKKYVRVPPFKKAVHRGMIPGITYC